MSIDSLHFKNFKEFLAPKLDKTFIIYSLTTTGKLESSITKYEKIKEVYNYIKTRYLDKPADLISRHIKIEEDKDQCLSIIQSSKYENFTSYKHYHIYSSNLEDYEELCNLIIKSKFIK